MSENPYAYTPEPEWNAPSGSGLVRHVRVFAILSLVQGTMEVLMGGLMGFAAVMLPFVEQLQRMEMKDEGEAAPMGANPMMQWQVGYMWVLLALLVAIGVLRIATGLRNFYLRGRTQAFVSLSVGLLSSLGCYCAPTAIGLFIYGLLILLDRHVTGAFAARSGGATVVETLHRFGGGVGGR